MKINKPDFRKGKDFENLYLKSWIQKDLYRTAKRLGIITDIVVVAGPALRRHILDARNNIARTPKSKVVIVENAYKTFKKQKSDYKNLTGFWKTRGGNAKSLRHNVHLKYGNVQDLVARAMDVDLMGTMTKEFHIYETLLERQDWLSQHRLKMLIGCCSLRGCDEKTTLRHIRKLVKKLGDKIINFGEGHNRLYPDRRGSYRYDYEDIKHTTNRIKNLTIIRYRECPGRDGKKNNGMNMLTWMIIWK